MKKHNRIIAGIMAVCIMGSVSLIPESVSPAVPMTASAETIQSGTCGENVTYTLDDEGTLTISGTGDMRDLYRAPWNYNEIKKVIIEDGVTSIGDHAFSDCSNLRSVIIPDSVTSIGAYSFNRCSSLTSVTTPDKVTSIGDCAFYDCSNLTSVTIPDSVTSIGDSAFEKCKNLRSVIIPDSVTSIGGKSFYNTSWLKKTQEENPLVIVNNIVIDGQKCSGDVVIPDGVTSISYSAFEECKNLTSIIIPDSIASIDKSTFYGCSSLTSIVIPDSVTSIGDRAFENCSNLTSIIIPDSVTSIGWSAFDGTPWLEAKQEENPLVIINNILIDGGECSGDVIIPDSVTRINDFAFYYCSSLTSVTIPDSVTSIGVNALYGCNNLTEITILNPECEIFNHPSVLLGDKNVATICGYKNSTAQAYAEEYGYKFKSLGKAPEKSTGDINGDGQFNVADIIWLQKYLLGEFDTEISNIKNADLNSDGVLDSFDICLMRQKLLEK